MWFFLGLGIMFSCFFGLVFVLPFSSHSPFFNSGYAMVLFCGFLLFLANDSKKTPKPSYPEYRIVEVTAAYFNEKYVDILDPIRHLYPDELVYVIEKLKHHYPPVIVGEYHAIKVQTKLIFAQAYVIEQIKSDKTRQEILNQSPKTVWTSDDKSDKI